MTPATKMKLIADSSLEHVITGYRESAMYKEILGRARQQASVGRYSLVLSISEIGEDRFIMTRTLQQDGFNVVNNSFSIQISWD